MSDNSAVLIIGIAAAAGAGIWYMNKQKSQQMPAQVPVPTGGGMGYTIPDNVSTQLQGVWSSVGSPTNPTDWENTASRLIPLSRNVWSAVFNQWWGFYQTAGIWPNDATLKGWIQTAINNYG